MRSYLLAGLRAAAAVLLATAVLLPGAAMSHAQSSAADPDMTSRIAAVDKYLAGRPGVTGYVVRDRATGWSHASAAANTMIWTASTIKLAMSADLLRRDRTRAVRLSADDRALIGRMLNVSDDKAADTLWYRYAGADHQDFQRAFRSFGMRDIAPQKGFNPAFEPYWGFQKTTPADLDRLIGYVLNQADPADRAYLVDQMRRVAPVQQWGVWGAGPAMAPGNKDGWSEEDNGWVVNSVGFAGLGERYTLSIMNSLERKGGFTEGRDTITHAAQLLLAGR